MSIQVMMLDDPSAAVAICGACDWRSPRLWGELPPFGFIRLSRLVAAEAGWVHLVEAQHPERSELVVGDVVTVIDSVPYGFLTFGELGVITAVHGDRTVDFESFVSGQLQSHSLRADRFSSSARRSALMNA